MKGHPPSEERDIADGISVTNLFSLSFPRPNNLQVSVLI